MSHSRECIRDEMTMSEQHLARNFKIFLKNMFIMRSEIAHVRCPPQNTAATGGVLASANGTVSSCCMWLVDKYGAPQLLQ